jgi:effector-associated domain 11 (EAD11)-containing protein
MSGINIPNNILKELRPFLMGFDEFDSNQALLAFIKLTQVGFLADYFPLGDTASNRAARVNTFIGYFKSKTLKDGRNALLLLLEDLPIPPEDSRDLVRQALIGRLAQHNTASVVHSSLSPLPQNKIGPPPEIATFKEKLKSLIAANQLLPALDTLVNVLSGESPHYNVAIGLKGRYQRMSIDDLKGVILPQDIHLLKNKLVADILALIDALHDYDFVKSQGS